LNSSVKTASTPQGDGKPAPAIGEADKQAATHPHDEVPANTHHAAGETPPPIMTDAQATAPKIAGDIVQQAALTPPSQDVSPAPANLATPAPPAAQAVTVPLAVSPSKSPARRWRARTASRFASIRPSSAASKFASMSTATAK
jgi:hypothetical protein